MGTCFFFSNPANSAHTSLVPLLPRSLVTLLPRSLAPCLLVPSFPAFPALESRFAWKLAAANEYSDSQSQTRPCR